jgi:hypothetical protein
MGEERKDRSWPKAEWQLWSRDRGKLPFLEGEMFQLVRQRYADWKIQAGRREPS